MFKTQFKLMLMNIRKIPKKRNQSYYKEKAEIVFLCY